MKGLTIGVVGNGPLQQLPDFNRYKNKIDVWIGADRGALHLVNNNLAVDYALGDFDSVSQTELELLKNNAAVFERYPVEKDKTDLEIAIDKAYTMNPHTIFLFGVTGARIDHELINIQLLQAVSKKGIKGIIIDKFNYIEWTEPGTHEISSDPDYPTISFIPVTEVVKGVTLKGFYYPLEEVDAQFGSTLTISNKLTAKNGTFSYNQGILLLIKSSDG